MSPSESVDTQPVDAATNQSGKFHMSAVLPLVGGCQSQPTWSDVHLRDLHIAGCREVMHLIEDYKEESIAKLFPSEVS